MLGGGTATVATKRHKEDTNDNPMPDLLVNLIKLPALEESNDFVVRRAQPFEISAVRSFVARNFSESWADEMSVGFARQPISVYIATIEREMVGFSAYECTRRGFFGPTGVVDGVRGKGIGKALLLASLWGLREMGYVYGIIGAAGPVRLRNTPKRLTSCVRQSSRGFARGTLALCVASARATEGTLDAGAALFKPDAGAALFKFVGAGEGSAGALIVAMFTPLWLAELSATLGASALRGKPSETVPAGGDEAIALGTDRNGAIVTEATSARRIGSDIRARATVDCAV